jgi:hypothetical protein
LAFETQGPKRSKLKKGKGLTPRTSVEVINWISLEENELETLDVILSRLLQAISMLSYTFFAFICALFLYL